MASTDIEKDDSAKSMKYLFKKVEKFPNATKSEEQDQDIFNSGFRKTGFNDDFSVNLDNFIFSDKNRSNTNSLASIKKKSVLRNIPDLSSLEKFLTSKKMKDLKKT